MEDEYNFVRIGELFKKGTWRWVGSGTNFEGEKWILDVKDAREIIELLGIKIAPADTE